MKTVFWHQIRVTRFLVNTVARLIGRQPMVSYYFIEDGGNQEVNANRLKNLCERTDIAFTLRPLSAADAVAAEKEFDDDPADEVFASAELATVWLKGTNGISVLWTDAQIIRMIQEAAMDASHQGATE